MTANGSPGLSFSSSAMRAKRAGSIFAWATRITSSNDMRTARCRAVSRSSRPLAPARCVGRHDRARGDRDSAAHRRGPDRRRAGARPRRRCRARPAGIARARSRARSRRATDAAACAGACPALAAARVDLPARAASRPARKPRRLPSDALPSWRIAASKASTAIGRRPEPAIRPSITALIDRAALLRQRLHVEQQRSLRVLLDRLQEALGVVAAVAHRHLLDHEVRAAGRADQQGAIGRDVAGRDGAARLEQLARHDQVDVADAGAQRQHRLAAAELAPGRRHDLDVVGGGAGALGDARDRRALRRQALRWPPPPRSSW